MIEPDVCLRPALLYVYCSVVCTINLLQNLLSKICWITRIQ